MHLSPKFWPRILTALALSAACGDSSNTPANGANAAGSGANTEKPTRSLSTSATHTCALRKAGVFCWGANANGQLGNESTSDSAMPVQAKVSAQDIAELAVQTGRSCVRRRSGKVSCWGANESGQLGDGTRNDSLKPVDAAVSDAKQLALSETSTCVLRNDNSVSCWGGGGDASNAAVAIEGLSDAIDVQSGPMSNYCARGKTGWTRCWHLQSSTTWSTPADVAALSGASAVALASAQEVCGIINNQIVCNDLSNGKSVPLQGSSGSIALISGLLAICAADDASTWGCWNILSPVVLETIGAMKRELGGPFQELATAGYRYCGLRTDNQVLCMESNASQQFAPVPDLPE